MPKIVLADTTIRALPLPEKGTADYWDVSLPNFGCRVSRGGAKTFVIKLHNVRRAIGHYPTISLSQARTEAKRMLAENTLGKFRPQMIGYQQALDLFIDEKTKSAPPRTVAEYKRLIELYFPFKGSLSTVSHQEFAHAVNRIPAPSERAHAFVAGKVFFNWAVKRRYITENPASGFTQQRQPARSRVLSDDELKRVWIAAEQIGGSFGTIVRLLILTGQRRGEITALQTSWIGNDTITLPSEITKNKREHTFPMGSLCQSILAPVTMPTTPSAFIFPARGRTETLFSGWSKAKAELDKISNVSGWTLHDIRRTVASNLAALGVQLPVIERLLNHVSGSFGGIVSVYQKHSFMPEMRAAIEKWETHLSSLLKSE
jgi:integrase